MLEGLPVDALTAKLKYSHAKYCDRSGNGESKVIRVPLLYKDFVLD